MSVLANSSPYLAGVSLDEFFQKVDFKTYIHPLFNNIFDYYNQELELYQVLRFAGFNSLTSSSDQVQLPCILPEHGGEDVNNSARYYLFDRDTGHRIPGVYRRYWFTCDAV